MLGYSIMYSSSTIFPSKWCGVAFSKQLKYFIPAVSLTQDFCDSQGSPLRKSASVGEWLVESKQMVCVLPLSLLL